MGDSVVPPPVTSTVVATVGRHGRQEELPSSAG